MKLFLTIGIICIFAFCLCRGLFAHEASVDEILETIINTKKDLVQEEINNGLKEENLVFLTIWNCDDTILHGDSTDGLKDENGKVVFKGLAQVAIEAGLSKKYPPKKGFPRFLKDYEKMEKKNQPKAFAYAAQILAGAKESDVLDLATKYFETTLKHHFFRDSKELIVALQNQGIQTRIISASPQLFVQGAGPFLNIPRAEINGMQTVVKDGVVTDQMVLPLTTRQGKVQKIEQIIKEILQDSQIKKVYVLAGFGNINDNDMVFLKWIAHQQLSKGKPLAVIGFHPPFVSQNFVSLLLYPR